MKQTVNPVYLLQKKKKQQQQQKKQSVHKQIVWAPCGHHGSVNQLNMNGSRSEKTNATLKTGFNPLKQVFFYF